MGELDDQLMALREAQETSRRNQLKVEAARAQDVARGLELTRDFVARVRAAGIEPVQLYNTKVEHRAGTYGEEPKILNKALGPRVWSVGPAGITWLKTQAHYLIDANGSRVVPGDGRVIGEPSRTPPISDPRRAPKTWIEQRDWMIVDPRGSDTVTQTIGRDEMETFTLVQLLGLFLHNHAVN